MSDFPVSMLTSSESILAGALGTGAIGLITGLLTVRLSAGAATRERLARDAASSRAERVELYAEFVVEIGGALRAARYYEELGSWLATAVSPPKRRWSKLDEFIERIDRASLLYAKIDLRGDTSIEASTQAGHLMDLLTEGASLADGGRTFGRPNPSWEPFVERLSAARSAFKSAARLEISSD